MFCPSTAVIGGGKVDHVGGLIVGLWRLEMYHPPPSVGLISNLWKVRWMYPVEMRAFVGPAGTRACAPL